MSLTRRGLLPFFLPSWLAAKKRHMQWADTSRGRPFSKDPSVIEFRGRYLLYFSLGPYRDGRLGDGWCIGIAESRNLIDWRVVAEVKPSGGIESKGICAPQGLVIGNEVHLFYQTYGNGRQDAICHAVSSDGLDFRRNPGNPIFHPSGAWNCGRAIDAEVVIDGERALLYCATRDPEFKVQMITGAVAPLVKGFTPCCWQQIGDGPILKPELEWEKRCIEAPTVFRRNGKFYMFYAGGYNAEPQQIGCAISSDGLSYQRLFQQPFLANGRKGEWNADESGHPGAFTDHKGRCYLFFQGTADGGKSFYLSHVRIGWRGEMPVILSS